MTIRAHRSSRMSYTLEDIMYNVFIDTGFFLEFKLSSTHHALIIGFRTHLLNIGGVNSFII